MPKILTSSSTHNLTPNHAYWLYNGLDCCITAEVHDELITRLEGDTARIYAFERAMQGPALTMQLRGLRVDEKVRQENLEILQKDAEKLKKTAEEECKALGGSGFKWGIGMAPPAPQLMKLFYDRMKLHVYRNKKTKNPTVDKLALARIAKRYPKARKLAGATLTLRDWGKQYEVFSKGLSPNGRFHCTFAVGQANTGRWSSYKDPYGYGDNLQNKDERLRNMFIPDPGMVFVNADLTQSDSRCIAYLANDERYIEAHETRNVHVEACKIFWPAVGWSKDEAENKEIAKLTPADWIPQAKPKAGKKPVFSLYKISKNNQHALNFGTKAKGLAQRIGSTVEKAEEYMERYFKRYYMIPEYHKYVRQCLSDTATLVTPLGRVRQFFGRPWEDATVREAIAFVPQSMTSDILCVGLWRVWKQLDPADAQLLLNGHDSILAQVPIGNLDFVVGEINNLMKVEVPVHGRTLIIPVEIQTGPNWRDLQ